MNRYRVTSDYDPHEACEVEASTHGAAAKIAARDHLCVDDGTNLTVTELKSVKTFQHQFTHKITEVKNA